MKRIFIDTNVMIDLLARRAPFYEEAKLIFSLVDIGRYTAVIAPISFYHSDIPVYTPKEFLNKEIG